MHYRAATLRACIVVTRKKKPKLVLPTGPPAEVGELMRRLTAAIPQPECELDHIDAWTLLIATILSAQSTDRTVNTVTPVLFEKWPTPEALAAAPREEVEGVVHRTGFFRNKAKAIQEASLVLHDRFGGEVPRDMAALVELPGVARKTANVVLGVAFDIAAGIVVDTHVMRVAQRLGLTSVTNADRVEQDLCRQLPREQWIDGGHRILLFGRYLCLARDPDCANCPLAEICPSKMGDFLGTWEERAVTVRARVESRGLENGGAKPA